jgi:hypothetical protein|tara:strand:- start:376 stop:876 length:501 start_codon:yes stop_codon:yes gene_type:complete
MKIELENKRKAIILTIIVFIVLFCLLGLPVFFRMFFRESFTYHIIVDYLYLFWIVLFLFLYFVSIGVFYYKIIFEDSSFLIRSRRSLSGLFGGKNYQLEISNDMLIGFKFFSRGISFNDTLLIQMRSHSRKKSAVRIPLTLLSKDRRNKISNILNNIIQKNECQTN